jgi:hypothetical protein
MVVPLVLVLLIPAVLMLGGFISSHINPEMAAGRANYARNFLILNAAKNISMLAAFAMAGALWLVSCFLVLRSKERSFWWILLAALGPVGFGVMAVLSDKVPGKTDRYARFVGGMKWWVRAGYEACSFLIIWEAAYFGMIVFRKLIILWESFRTGMSTAQIVDLQNASSGMWAFGEGLEIMFMVVVFYLARPIAFNVMSRLTATTEASECR